MDIKAIEENLEQNDRIIQIFSESLPHLTANNLINNNKSDINNNNNNNKSLNVTNGIVSSVQTPFNVIFVVYFFYINVIYITENM